jgi:alginate O-acetyltransferase complex protein AlgI
MHFCSEQYLIFFLTVFALYWSCPWHNARIGLLLIGSFFFYASWNQWLAVLICATSLVDYLVARGIEKAEAGTQRRLLLMISLVMNLGILCYFKYANFFLESFEKMLEALGIGISLPLLAVILPIGISFYTFEAINYCVDVYRGKARAERNLAHFLLFITFFPHLVAGPIVRARDFLFQIRRRKRWNWLRVQLGIQYIVIGLVKKWVIADRMAAWVDPVFANPEWYRTSTVWVGVLAYALQIYGDFSGYSDIAIGSAHLLGYKLALNFNMPYLATNIAEFWRRWHISLSTWLRDYLFIPLGGSRGTRWLTYRNLLLTMTLGGLWHGAKWTFIVWGLGHGLLLIGHRLFQAFCEQRPLLEKALRSSSGTVLRTAITFLCVALGWVLFRAASFETACGIFLRLVAFRGGMYCPVHPMGMWITLFVLFGCQIATQVGFWRHAVARLPEPVLGLGYALLFSFALLLSPASDNTFIYFQF